MREQVIHDIMKKKQVSYRDDPASNNDFAVEWQGLNNMMNSPRGDQPGQDQHNTTNTRQSDKHISNSDSKHKMIFVHNM